MIQLLRGANLTLGIVNVMLFALWWSIIKVDAIPKGTQPAEYALNQLSVNVAVLGVIMTTAALLIAGMAFFGWHSVVERAEARADKAAREVVTSLISQMRNQPGFAVIPTGQTAPLPDVGAPTEAKEG